MIARVYGRMSRLRSSATVESEHPAESLDAFDWAGGRSRSLVGLDQSIIDPLVIPLPVVMSGELASRFPK